MTGHIHAEQGRGPCIACKVMPGKGSKVCTARWATYQNVRPPPTTGGAVGARLDREWAAPVGGER